MNGPDYLRAAAKHLAAAEQLEANRPFRASYADRDRAEFTRHMDLFKANADMARLALDAAKAVAGGHLVEGFDLGADSEDVDPLTRNANAWAAAVTEGGA
jgi:hypothetical protein